MAAEQIASEGYKAVELVVASCLGGVIGTIVTFYINRKLQSLKHKHDKQFTVHNLQFKKEFQLYSELWKALIALRQTVIITLDLEINDESTFREKYEKAVKNFNEVKNLFENNRPFYHVNVSKLAGNLISKCRKYITHAGKNFKSEKYNDQLSDEAEVLLRIVPEAIDKIGEAIQKRIGMSKEAEIFE